MDSQPEEARNFYRCFRLAVRRLRARAALRTLAILLPWLQMVWLILFVGERLGLLTPPVPPIASVLGAVLAGGVLWSFWRCPTGRDAALVLDRRLGTRELVTTAHDPPAADHPLLDLARERAAAALAAPAVSRALPLTVLGRWRPVLLGLVAVLLSGLVPPLRQRATAVEKPDPAVRSAAATLAEELGPLAEEIAALDRPEAREALRRLEQLVDEMASGDLPTVEDALVALNKAEEDLGSLSRERPSDSLGQLLEDMAAEPLSSELARAMAGEDRDALREALRRMAEAMSAEEARSEVLERQIERLAERFEALAALLEERGESALAAQLRELAEALRSGDLERAKELLGSEGVAAACQLAGEGKSAGDEVSELLSLARYLLGGKPSRLGAEDVAGPGGRKSGPGPGPESTNLEAEGYETGDPRLRDRRSTRSSDRTGELEALYESRIVRGEGFEDVRTRGHFGGEGEMLSETGRGLGVDGGVSLPLRPFAGGVPGAAERAIDLESVPQGYRDLVRSYFSRDE